MSVAETINKEVKNVSISFTTKNLIKENKCIEAIQKSKTMIDKAILNLPKYGNSGIALCGHLFTHPLPLTYALKNINTAEIVID